MTEEDAANSGRKTGGARHAPRAIIHKQILEYAEANPEDSMEAIAESVSGATVSTVERVLEEYGDPAGETTAAAETSTQTPTATDGGAAADSVESAGGGSVPPSDGPSPSDEESDATSEPELDRSSLTEKQRETLRAIYDHPDATQAELAEMLGVSSPTISQRVNSIEGFDWSDRVALVEPLFESDDVGDVAMTDGSEPTDADETVTGRGSSDPRPSDDDSVDADRAESYVPTDDGGGSDATRDSGTDPADRDRERPDPASSRTRAVDRSTDPSNEDSGGDTVDDDRLAALADRVDELAQRIETMDAELESLEERNEARGSASALADPELAHKIIYACFNSDRITEEEELRLLRDVTTAGTAVPSDGARRE